MKRTSQLVLAVVFSFSSFIELGYAEANARNLTVSVVGAKARVGQVILSVFSSTENYLKEPIYNEIKPVDESGHAQFQVALSQGVYAVSAVYDENGNDKLDTGFLGIPKELVAFSNNAKGRFGPPKFDDSSFPLRDDLAIEIRLAKAKD